ncbi:hypothetical protein BpHYR1_039458 [Brachionus plicatilis]|uniref:Uncharacterized protein n=1 Tax=Brachionus plicatilis TaxID=10195 RepID=A0A3M7PAM8_BRAPC|nr:hypothetical protein BpHYR1_039458 [Brachionus plicatilis]
MNEKKIFDIKNNKFAPIENISHYKNNSIDCSCISFLLFVYTFMKMGLPVSEREAFRKAVKTMISQMTKSDLVAHFIKEGIAPSTIYNAINRIQIGDPLINFLNLFTD